MLEARCESGMRTSNPTMSQAFSFQPTRYQSLHRLRRMLAPPETSNLANMAAAARSRLITDCSRFMLFKALSVQPIDRSKLAKECFTENLQNARVVNATAVKAVSTRMQDVFGLSVKRAPHSILTNTQMPSKYNERLFVVNDIQDFMIERGLVMLVLAFIYCKGEVKDHMRWLSTSVLFRLLHSVVENTAAEPVVEGKNKRECIGSISSPHLTDFIQLKRRCYILLRQLRKPTSFSWHRICETLLLPLH